MATATNKRKQQQRQAVVRVLMMVGILILINILASRYHRGFDLTKEKRFTLSDATKNMLKDMKEVAVVDVYLTGKFPAGFQRLSEATRERLQSFKDYGGSKVVFRFIDPFEGKNESEKTQISKSLYEKGIEPVSLNVKGDQNSSEQIIYPYALVQYQGRSMPVKLLENHLGMSPLEVLNYSESLLEYKLASAIHKLQTTVKPRIAYIMGHGEQLGPRTFDLLTTLTQHYFIDTLDLPSEYRINDAIYRAIIINKPTIPFDEKEKFKIDQYIMHGGRVLWAVDMLHTPVDSLQSAGQFITQEYGLNLDDQFFKYGLRVNYDLIEDVQCNQIPLITGTMGNGQPQIELRPWTFLPIFTPTSKHPIVNNMDAIMGNFANSIDTIQSAGIRKTILLESSNYSRSAAHPVRVSLSMIRYNPDPKLFTRPYRPVAVLTEGKFFSLFNNRMPQSFLNLLRDSLKYNFKKSVDSSNSMIVIADGDIMLNTMSRTRGFSEMGYWEYTQALFANKNFILNCLEYLTDPHSLLEARNKDVKLRLLDTKRAKDEELKWQFINVGVPLLLVLIFASAYLFFRKRRYELRA
ncbi:MAG TPA: gliding motility-associated ABC transporter substrate-binding protein GldG [Flavipsychrobacter sp.]|nr:gliding motility-associated ABC transporter substrate-binding protein GldG [Flavipsychrobacter sp.]